MRAFKHRDHDSIGMVELPEAAVRYTHVPARGAVVETINEAWYYEGWWYTREWCGSVAIGYRPQQETAQAYPDGNPKSIQGAKKKSLRFSPTAALLHMGAAFEDGAVKYGAANWREKGVASSVYIDAALRHIALYFDGGEQVASDSKVHHLGHAMACLAIILDAEAAGTLKDDRPTPMPNLEALLKRS